MSDAPHRLTGLEVDEVSLVDRPAINRKFLVVKAAKPGEQEPAMDDDKKDPKNKPSMTPEPKPGMKKEESAMADGDKTFTQAEVDKMIADAAAKASTTAKAEGRAEAERSSAETVAKALEASTARVAALEKSTRIRDYRDHVVTKKWSGDSDKNAALCEEMHAALPEATFKSWMADKDATALQLETSGIFKEIGSGVEGEHSSTDTLMKKVVSARSDIHKSGTKLEPGDEFDRISAVFEEDPDLYARSREEHMTKVRLAGIRR